MKLITGKEKKQLIEQLKEYGIEKPNYLFFLTGKEKIRGYSGSLSREEINNLAREARLEIIGTYLFKKEKDGIRLSLEACHLLKPTKRIIEISDEQAKLWIKGQDIEINNKEKINPEYLKAYIIIKHRDNFLGSGKIKENKILNFIPKERRIRN